MAKSKRPGGNQREALQRTRKRPEAYAAEMVRQYQERCPAPDNTEAAKMRWLAQVVQFAIDSAMTDPGLSPEHRRQQVASLAPQMVKALEPAKLARRIAELEEELARVKQNGGTHSRGKVSRPREATPIQ